MLQTFLMNSYIQAAAVVINGVKAYICLPNSVESHHFLLFLVVPPIIISLLSGRTTAKHLHRHVVI